MEFVSRVAKMDDIIVNTISKVINNSIEELLGYHEKVIVGEREWIRQLS